jgi:flagellar hook-length control protein FliK
VAPTATAVVLASPFATQLAGILEAAPASVTGAAGGGRPSSQLPARGAQTDTTAVTSPGADVTPIAGWVRRVSTNAQGKLVQSSRTRVTPWPRNQQRLADSQDIGSRSANAMTSAFTGKIEAVSSVPTITLAEVKQPGGQDVPEDAMAAVEPPGGTLRTQPGAMTPLSADASWPWSTPDTASGAMGSASPSSSPATNTLSAMPLVPQPLRWAGTPPTGSDPRDPKAAGLPPASQTSVADAALSAAAVVAAPDAAPARAARGGAIGVRQVSSNAVAAGLAEVFPPASAAIQDAPVGIPSRLSGPSETDHVSASAGDNAPAPQADSPAAAAPGTDSPADPAVPGAAAGRARPDATALTSPAPAPDATALVAPAAAPASPADMGVPATPSVTAVAPRTVTATPATGPAAPTPSALAASSESPSPAQQAVSALVSLGGGQGSRQVTVRLDPPELGRLQIRLVQSKDGPAQVTVTAERSQTLDLLVRDQTRLSRALDQAGVPAEGRSVTFHLAATVSNASADPSRNAPSPATPGAQSTGSGASDAGNGSNRGPQRDGYASGPWRMADGSNDLEDDTPRTVRWLRAGIDITA